MMSWSSRSFAARWWLVVAGGPRDQYVAPEMQEIVCFPSISNFHFITLIHLFLRIGRNTSPASPARRKLSVGAYLRSQPKPSYRCCPLSVPRSRLFQLPPVIQNCALFSRPGAERRARPLIFASTSRSLSHLGSEIGLSPLGIAPSTMALSLEPNGSNRMISEVVNRTRPARSSRRPDLNFTSHRIRSHAWLSNRLE
jgi:hypothetical protein